VSWPAVVSQWGTTAAERERPYPCDGLIERERPATELYRGIDVDAPQGTAFRWLCQLRAAPYSYDWIDNWGRRSPQTLTPGLEDLAPGQTVIAIFTLVSFEKDRHLTLRFKPGTLPARIFDVAATYLIVPQGDGSCRLLGKLRVRHPRAPLGWLTKRFLPLGDLLMMRRQLLNLKRLAEAAVTSG